MKKFYFFALLLLPALSFAQSNYKNGYVINLKGDTLKGLINLKDWGHNPVNISFKTNENERPQELGFSDINYFQVDGYVAYAKYKVVISLNNVDINSALSAVDTSTVTNTVFLKVLQKGKYVTLYTYTDGLKNRYYVKDNDADVPYELLYGIYQNPQTENIINKNTFQSQLNQLVFKYKTGDNNLIRQVQQSAYSEGDLTQIIAKINGSSVNTATHLASRNNTFRFFAGAALSSNSLKTSVDLGTDELYGTPTVQSTVPKINVGVDAFINPGVGRLLVRLEVAYSANSYTLTGAPNPLYNEAAPIVGQIKIKQSLLGITPQVIYNIYNAAAIKVFVDGGAAFNITSYPTREYVSLKSGQPIDAPYTLGRGYFKSMYVAVQFKAGVVVSKRFEIYGAFYPGTDISNSDGQFLKVTSYQAGLNYFIGKVAH